MKKIILSSLFLFFLLAFPDRISASTSLPITLGIPTRPATEGEIIHTSTFQINYSGQKVVLSSTADGVGIIDINDTLEFLVTNSNGVVTRYTRFFGGCSGPINDKATDLTSFFTSHGEAIVQINILNCGPDAASGPLYLTIDDQIEGLMDTGFVSPTTYQIIGGSWQNPENAFDDDSDFASIGTAISGSRAIRYFGYNFNIPADAEVKGIAVRLDAAGNKWGGLNNIYQGGISGNHGMALGDDHLRMGTLKSYIGGSPSELWGRTWTPQNIDNLAIEYGAAAVTVHQLHWVAAKVYYTLSEPQAIVLDVPSFKQGLLEYDGSDPYWENTTYDNGGQLDLWCDTNNDGAKMYECACALTSAAMVMNYFGVTKTPLGNTLDPAYLNIFAEEILPNGGHSGFVGGNFRWDFVGNFSKTINGVFPEQPKLEQPVREDFSVDRVKQLIDDDKPVILRVNNGSHWVVAKGYNPNTNQIIINDPVRPDSPVGEYMYLDDFYTPDPNGSMIVYETTNSDYHYLQFATTSQNHLLVEDESGNKTGYDSASGQVLKGIPNSDYVLDPYYSSPVVDGAAPTTEGIYFLTIKLPADGEFELQVVSQDGVPHPVQVYSSDTEGSLAGKTLEPGSTEFGYNVVYLEDMAGEEVEVSIEAQIDIVPFLNSNVIIPHKWIPAPVAILASDSFGVEKVDRSSLTFGKTGDEASLISCSNKLVDVNKDKNKDLICYFYGDKLGLDTPDTEAILRGKYEDIVFEGMGTVKVFKPWFLF